MSVPWSRADARRLQCRFDAAPTVPYPLDRLSRVVPPKGRLMCARRTMTVYGGRFVRYQKPVRVHPAFVDKLQMFERLVAKLGEAHYGRPPRRIVHVGTYNCRRIRQNAGWLSEHALGNGIDVIGFDFGPLPDGAALPTGLDRRLRGRFRVRLTEHWQPERAWQLPHERFLRHLATELRASPEMFRTVLGPPQPRHDSHFHLDYGPEACLVPARPLEVR